MPITIAEPSFKSLLVEMRFNNQPLATGTAFIVQNARGALLVTNRHNVTGRRPDNGQPLSPTGGVPNQIVIVHNAIAGLGQWITKTESLCDDDGNPRWIEHPVLRERGDFVALPLTQLDAVKLYPYDLNNLGPEIMVGPADNVSVVGFPFGLSAGGALAVWATGFIASEPGINYNDLPIFLIDCRARQGQSGSAVIAYRSGGAIALERNNTIVGSGPVYRFLGIYSGRINSESDLGLVWKASAIKELVDQ